MKSKEQVAISIEGISKKFELGTIGADTFREQLSNGIRGLKGGHKRKKDASEFWALTDISFEVKPGEVVGIIGKNGAGKSTLLKVLSRITPPTKGVIEVNGRLSSLLEVGTGFHPELTGRENIFLNGAILGMRRTEIQKQFNDIVRFAGIEKFIDTPVKRYSSGMYVRLAFAVAAHLQPEILIIDEVLAVGDYEFQKKCLGKMNEIAQEGRTVIFVSHNMGAVAELCNRAILLENGKVVLDSYDVRGAIETYIQKFRTNKPFEQDLASDDSSAELKCQFTQIAAYNHKNESVSEFDLTESVRIQMKYTVHSKIQGLRIGLILIKNGVQDMFYTFNNEDDNYEEWTDVGNHEDTYLIPKAFLKEGPYSLTLTLGSSGICYQKLEKCFDFDIVNHFTNTENKGYKKERNGLIIAPGNWSKKS